MKPFWTIAIPHRDILEGRLTMDVFAADLWQVFKGEAPDEYKDPDLFFKKTYITKGMQNLFDVVKKRLDGEGGDAVIQLQTPFGGGKTHSLIALYHKAKEWKANVVVIDGTALDAQRTTIWAEIERQLTGSVELLKENTAPGRENLKNVLEKHQPLLILMDEILEYATKAAGVKVGDTNLASQTLAFMHEITETVATLPRSALVLTLPSSLLEHYDENAERLFQQIQKISGRLEKIYTPVEDEEVALVITKRLFSHIDEQAAKDTIEEFLNYAERENILPMDKPTYRERFMKSFPFQPEVIDVLYKRWGSLPSFQRTRGVLRLLALVVHSLKDSKIPFIRLGDFDLKNQEIRRELIKHIGQEYDSIIAQDITSEDSGAKKVDRSLGDAYLPFSFGTKCATAIFMYSFSGGPEKGATINEIKLSCADPSHPSSIIVEAIDKLKEKLFYISDEGLFFTNQPNLNRIILTKMESVDDMEVQNQERELLKGTLNKKYFDIYIWPNNTRDVPDTKRLKLVVLRSKEKRKEFLEKYGEKPRIFQNTLIFLCPLESERLDFERSVRKKLALELIRIDQKLKLTDEQKKRVENELKNTESELRYQIRNLYRLMLIPSKNGLKEVDLGIYTYGLNRSLEDEVYEMLRNEGEILEKLAPSTLKDKYLGDKDYVETKNILESFYKTPGEIRIVSDEVLKSSIKQGVKEGLFGIGILEDGKPVCKYFKEDCDPELEEGEVIIKKDLCQEKAHPVQASPSTFQESMVQEDQELQQTPVSYPETKKEEEKVYRSILLKLKVQKEKLDSILNIVRAMLYLKEKFDQVDIRIEISAKNGQITLHEYEDKVKENINQARIEVENEDVH